jgi:hypothetical protein
MRPYESGQIWRKHQRATHKGIPGGRRATHQVKTQDPTPGSSWSRRHPRDWPPHLRPWIGASYAADVASQLRRALADEVAHIEPRPLLHQILNAAHQPELAPTTRLLEAQMTTTSTSANRAANGINGGAV